MKIKNINGTGSNICKCGSWLKHWENYNPEGQSIPTYCPADDCLNRSEIGAHVLLENSNSWYIVPFCKECNAQRGKSLIVSDSISLASANIRKTCGKIIEL